MYIFLKDQNDFIIIDSDKNTIRFLDDEEKVILLDIFPQLCDLGTKSVIVDNEKLPGEMRAFIDIKTIQ